MKTLDNFKSNILENSENVKGGMTIWDIIDIAWNATPGGCNSHWVNYGTNGPKPPHFWLDWATCEMQLIQITYE
jgi:hypothetical protein